MRETELWRRLDHHLGSAYARVWSAQTVLAELDGRTVDQALAAGVPTRQIWLAVWAHLELPATER